MQAHVSVILCKFIKDRQCKRAFSLSYSNFFNSYPGLQSANWKDYTYYINLNMIKLWCNRNMSMELKDFWAKTGPFQSVYTHSMISGKVAQILTREYLSTGVREFLSAQLSLGRNDLISFIGYLVALHDIGKLDYSFQVRYDLLREKLLDQDELNEIYMPGVRHEKTSQMFLHSFWKAGGEERHSSSLFSLIVGAHHQGKKGNGNFRTVSQWQEYRNTLENRIRAQFYSSNGTVLPATSKTEQGAVGALLLGIMILADWISSGSTFSDAEQWIESSDAQDRIEKDTRLFLEKSGLKPEPAAWPDDFCGLWLTIPAAGKRPMQYEIERQLLNEDEKPLLVLIEAPMGEGKTEAGIYAAIQMAKYWGRDGLYVALPTAATANQMVGRVQGMLNLHDLSQSVRLLHSMAWLELSEETTVNSQDEHDEIASWLTPIKRGLLGQYAVGTVDQAMLAATNVKYGVLRLLGLSNKVLIIDEIHSYDAYMSEIIVRLLEWCRALQIPVVLLSATLPPSLKEKLLAPYTSQPLSGNYPLITMIGKDGTLSEHIIAATSHQLSVSIHQSPSLNNPDKIADAAVKEVENGGCLCVLMNTVKEAQDVYRAIEKQYSGDLLLFHAQFPAGQRAEIEQECICRYGKEKTQRPKQSILVATQVVEQSLDVDFDAMITAVAPIDLLLQRMGRVFRHEDTPRPASHPCASVTVLTPEENNNYGASAYVYPECLLKTSQRLLKERDLIRIPEDLAALVQDGYDPSAAPEEDTKQWMAKLLKDEVEAGASQQFLLNTPDKLFSALSGQELYDDGDDFLLSAKTRLGEPSVRIALLQPDQAGILGPFLKKKGTKTFASVWDKKVAELVMKQSVSVRASRLGDLSELSDIKGDILLTGTRILCADDMGCCHLGNGKSLQFDPKLGLMIREGEL